MWWLIAFRCLCRFCILIQFVLIFLYSYMRVVSSRFYALLLCLAQAPALIGSRAQGHSYLGATAFQRATSAKLSSVPWHTSPRCSTTAIGGPTSARWSEPNTSSEGCSSWLFDVMAAARLSRAGEFRERQARAVRLQRLGLGRVPPRAAEYPGGIRAYHPGGIRAYHASGIKAYQPSGIITYQPSGIRAYHTSAQRACGQVRGSSQQLTF